MIKLITDWKSAWKFASVQLSVLGFIMMSMSDTVIQVWNQLPVEMKADLPNANTVGMVMFALTVLGRLFVLQGKQDG